MLRVLVSGLSTEVEWGHQLEEGSGRCSHHPQQKHARGASQNSSVWKKKGSVLSSSPVRRDGTGSELVHWCWDNGFQDLVSGGAGGLPRSAGDKSHLWVKLLFSNGRCKLLLEGHLIFGKMESCMAREQPLCAHEWRNATPWYSSSQDIKLISLRRLKLRVAFISLLSFLLEESHQHPLLAWILPDVQRFVAFVLANPHF